jgi:phosphomannomutase
MSRKLISLILSFCFLFQQSSFAQVAAVELNLAGHLARLGNSLAVESFRPVHLRYFSYDTSNNTFKVLLDKGDSLKGLSPSELSQSNLKGTLPEKKLKQETKALLNYFLIGLTLPNDTFWVNLRPDSEDSIIEDRLSLTDVGRIMLEADLQLKKDTASFTSPNTPEGRVYWDKLYKKAEELYGFQTVEIPTLTRPWIVPGEIIVRETKESAYIYKATLKVMLESDYLKTQDKANAIPGLSSYTFKDERSKALNEYSSQLIRELIIPKLTKEVNTSKNYASLRQVYYSLILSRWFKSRFASKKGLSPSELSQGNLKGTVPSFIELIDSQDLTNLTSTQPWYKSTYFNAYKKSFTEGEYNLKEPHYTPTGQVIRSYMSGGIKMAGSAIQLSGAKIAGTIDNMPQILSPKGWIALRGEGTSPLPLTIFDSKVARVTQGAASPAKSSSAVAKIAPQDALIQIDYIMKMLGVNDYPRVMKMLEASVDPVAFVENGARLSGKTIQDFLAILDQVSYFAPISAYYRVKTQKSIAPMELSEKSIGVSVTGSGYNFMPRWYTDVPGAAMSDYLRLMRKMAATVPFVFRDDMHKFVGRFLGINSTDKDTPDLQDTVDILSEYLSLLNLNKIKYIFTSGIGANEMYSHQLRATLNAFFQALGWDVRWIVVNNPEHLSVIPDDANDENSVVFEMSRSGGTKESTDFFEATTKENARFRFTKRIVAANGGRLKELALGLQKEESARVLIIDNTPGYIGGRQMNRKTPMTDAPLFIALAAGLKDIAMAKELLREYVAGLYFANQQLSYKKSKDSPAVELAEFLFKNRESGRNKFSIIYDNSLKGTAKELIQLLNEGANKNVIPGSANDNILDSYSLQDDRDLYVDVFSRAGDSQLPIFLLSQSNRDARYRNTLAWLEEMSIPTIVVSVDLKQIIPAFSREFLKSNLSALARTTALLQDMAVYFTYITRQDANSNPEVKLVREITAVMPEIIIEKKKQGKDIKITLSEVLGKINQKEETDRAKAKKSIDNKAVVASGHDRKFENLQNSILELANKSGLDPEITTGLFIGSVSKDALKIDLGEAGGRPTAEINEAFLRSHINPHLGNLAAQRQLKLVRMQEFLEDSKERRVSVVLPQVNMLRSEGNLAEKLADYFLAMYKYNHGKTKYFALTFMESDENNPAIKELRDYIVQVLGDLDITCLRQPMPGFAHTGIEGPMSHPEKIINITIAYTDTYGGTLGGLGLQPVGDLTLDETLYMYIMSNSLRMPLGGTPSVFFELKDRSNLGETKDIIKQSVQIFRNKLNQTGAASSAVVTSSAATGNSDVATDEEDSIMPSVSSAIQNYQEFIAKKTIKFGTSGWRFTEADYIKDGKFMKEWFLNDLYATVAAGAEQIRLQEENNPGRKGVIIGCDTRATGPYTNLDLVELSAQKLASMGIKVYKIDHYCPLPVVSNLIRQLGAAGSMYFTASHNPGRGYMITNDQGETLEANNNGLKFNPAHSGPAEEAITEPLQKKIGELRQSKQYNLYDKARHALNIEILTVAKIAPLYIKALKEIIDFEAIRRAFERGTIDYMIIDPKHGSATEYFHRIMAEMGLKDGVQYEIINPEPDPSFKQWNPEKGYIVDRPEPIAKHSSHMLHRMNELRQAGKKVIGISCDPDADRVGVISGSGKEKEAGFIDPNNNLAIEAQYLLQQEFGKWLKRNQRHDIAGQLDIFINAVSFYEENSALIKKFVAEEKIAIAKTIPTSHILYEIATLWQCPIYDTKVGFKYANPYLSPDTDTPVLIFGEESQGLNIKSRVNNPLYAVLEKDALVAGLKMAEIVSVSKFSPKELEDKLQDVTGYFAYNRGGVDLRELTSLDKIDWLKAELKKYLETFKAQYENGEITELSGKKIKEAVFDDGYKIIFEDRSWFCIRFSGTEPVVRLYTEATAKTWEAAENIRQKVHLIGEELLKAGQPQSSSAMGLLAPPHLLQEIHRLQGIPDLTIQAKQSRAQALSLIRKHLSGMPEEQIGQILEYVYPYSESGRVYEYYIVFDEKKIAELEESCAASPAKASSAVENKGPLGGIDFKHQAMASATTYETFGSFLGLDFSLPKLSASALLSFDLDKEAGDIEKAIEGGIIVSGQRIKEFIAASLAKGQLSQRRDNVIAWLAKLGMLEEAQCCMQESSREYREALVIAESYAAI